MPLLTTVVQEDQRLETAAEAASEALARHRWHWTIDESNPDRVSIKEYAESVGRASSTINKHANGFAIWRNRAGAISLSEAIERANMGAEKQTVTAAVATARGVSFHHTRQERPTEIRRVQEIARDRAERHGTTIEEEAPKVAEAIARAERVGIQAKQVRKDRLGLRFIQMEEKLNAVKRSLVEAVNLAHDIEWGHEETELLQSTLDNLKSLLNLIDVAFVGGSKVNWDKELERLTKGA